VIDMSIVKVSLFAVFAVVGIGYVLYLVVRRPPAQTSRQDSTTRGQSDDPAHAITPIGQKSTISFFPTLRDD
jgi:hypothetical protein